MTRCTLDKLRRSAACGPAPVKFLGPLFIALLLAFATDGQHPTQAQDQMYCAMYSDGSKSCGIPTLASCEQSVSGVGGVCMPDETSQQRPAFFDRRRLFQGLQEGSSPDQGGTVGGNLDQMPPPPDE
jgi:hypothetical protein